MTYVVYPVVHGRSAPTNPDSFPPDQRSVTQTAGGYPQTDCAPQGRERVHVGDRQATAGGRTRGPLRDGRAAFESDGGAAGDPAQGRSRANALACPMDCAGLLRAAGVRGVFQEPTISRILHWNPEGVRRRPSAPCQTVGPR